MSGNHWSDARIAEDSALLAASFRKSVENRPTLAESVALDEATWRLRVTRELSHRALVVDPLVMDEAIEATRALDGRREALIQGGQGVKDYTRHLLRELSCNCPKIRNEGVYLLHLDGACGPECGRVANRFDRLIRGTWLCTGPDGQSCFTQRLNSLTECPDCGAAKIAEKDRAFDYDDLGEADALPGFAEAYASVQFHSGGDGYALELVAALALKGLDDVTHLRVVGGPGDCSGDIAMMFADGEGHASVKSGKVPPEHVAALIKRFPASDHRVILTSAGDFTRTVVMEAFSVPDRRVDLVPGHRLATLLAEQDITLPTELGELEALCDTHGIEVLRRQRKRLATAEVQTVGA